MTWHARAFVGIIALRQFGIAALIWWSSLEFPEGSYRIINELSPLGRWAWLFAACATVALAAAVTNRLGLARLAIMSSVLLTSAWAIGFTAAAIDGTLVTPTAPVVWGALAAKDVILALSPWFRERPGP